MFIFAYMDIKLNFSWQFKGAKSEHEIEPVLFALLELIKKHGSLKKAAERANVSYRYAWGLLNAWQTRLGQALVILEPGRGASLSNLGEHLINANLQLKSRFMPELDNFSTQFKREFESLLNQSDTTSLNIFASHGLAIGALRDLINHQSDFELDLHFHGSLESLRALQNKQCDIAGFHIPIGPVATELLPNYLDILSAGTHQLIYVVKRNQGLIFKASNPKNITAIQSLTDPSLRFINRQTGSGTRLLLDQLLLSEGIKTNQINGYDQEEFTHLAVAALVASGAADVGFGIAPMAEKFNLGFIPIVWEHYCLAVPKELAKDERVKQITALLRSDEFKSRLSSSTGYQSDRAGESVTFDEIFGGV